MDAGAPITPDVLADFHPLVAEWFRSRFDAPTDAQLAGWPAIRTRRDVLLAAPTGSGKTLTAFLAGIDELVRLGQEQGELPDETRILYVSPLKALSNDIQRNLEEPLREMTELARARAERGADTWGAPMPRIRTVVRTGDTPQSARRMIVKRPPHILITTPESLYLMLTAEQSRAVLRTVRTVIVDEIHALVRDKRGSHLSLSLARLDHVAEQRPVRIGLSATQKPMDQIATFLTGLDDHGQPLDCEVLDLGHQRQLQLWIETTDVPLTAIPTHDLWDSIYDRLGELVSQHRTTLIFVNTRALAERVAHRLTERVGKEHVASHHGSLAKERRHQMEQRLKAGDLKAVVATASLELGIDIGAIDLVCQIGSPRRIGTFLQRVGRSGHALGRVPHGALFPTALDELIECAAMIRAVSAGALDRISQPVAPIEVLAQQIVAEIAAEPTDEGDLYDQFKHAAPYRELDRETYEATVEMLATGVGEGGGRSRPLIHRDRINHMLRPRRSARLTALLNGGVIPETGDFRVVKEPDGAFIGTVNEDFAIESHAGDIFLLGTTSWRIRRVESKGVVRVEDAHGAPPTVPFWLGEAPGRSVELSSAIGELRRDVTRQLDDLESASLNLQRECHLSSTAAEQLLEYLGATHDALGTVPSDTDVVFERFFDEAGGQQLVVHAPFGSGINRAWGLALRKRFCVRFDFELQAAANEEGIILSLGPSQSFPLEEAFDYLKSSNVEEAMRQAVLYAPFWNTRWRWAATRALAVPRMRSGKKVPPNLQRMIADDLLAAVFPAQVGCQENLAGSLVPPDHPLITQTMDDCLHEAVDTDGLIEVLQRVEAGQIRLHARDTVTPSPMAQSILNINPFGFLDNAPLEERRARAVMTRRSLPEQQRDLGQLDIDAIERVREEATPPVRDAEELHDLLLSLVSLDLAMLPVDRALLDELIAEGRAATATSGDLTACFAAEHLPAIQLLFPEATIEPQLDLPPGAAIRVADREDARVKLARGHMEVVGPITSAATRQALRPARRRPRVRPAPARGAGRDHARPVHPRRAQHLRRLTRPTRQAGRRVLRPPPARPHPPLHDRPPARRDRAGLGPALPPLPAALAAPHPRHTAPGQGRRSRRDSPPARLRSARRRLGARPARAPRLRLPRGLARRTLPLRRRDLGPPHRPSTRAGQRRNGNSNSDANGATAPRPSRPSPSRATPITVALRRDFATLLAATRRAPRPAPARGRSAPPPTPSATDELDGAAGQIHRLLRERGALFFDELVDGTRRIATDVENGLRELIAAGLAHADGFQGLRQLSRPASSRRRRPRRPRYGGGGVFIGEGPAGRWAPLPATVPDEPDPNPRRRARRSHRPHPARPLRRCLARADDARERLDALARDPPRPAPPRSPRRNPRRTLHSGPDRRAVRAPRGHRSDALPAPHGRQRRPAARDRRRRPLQSSGHPAPRPQGPRAPAPQNQNHQRRTRRPLTKPDRS